MLFPEIYMAIKEMLFTAVRIEIGVICRFSIFVFIYLKKKKKKRFSEQQLLKLTTRGLWLSENRENRRTYAARVHSHVKYVAEIAACETRLTFLK